MRGDGKSLESEGAGKGRGSCKLGWKAQWRSKSLITEVKLFFFFIVDTTYLRIVVFGHVRDLVAIVV